MYNGEIYAMSHNQINKPQYPTLPCSQGSSEGPVELWLQPGLVNCKIMSTHEGLLSMCWETHLHAHCPHMLIDMLSYSPTHPLHAHITIQTHLETWSQPHAHAQAHFNAQSHTCTCLLTCKHTLIPAHSLHPPTLPVAVSLPRAPPSR